MTKDNVVNSSNLADADKVFVGLFLRNQRKIYAYIASFMVSANDAEDVLQESVFVMMKKFHRFEQGTDFLAWATTIAYYCVLEFRSKKARQELVFDDTALEYLQEVAKQRIQDTDESLDYLQKCIDKLSDNDRTLITLRYTKEMPVRDISNRFGRTLQSVYRSIARIQDLLRICIKRELASLHE